MDHQDWETIILKKKKSLTPSEKLEVEKKKEKYNKFLKEQTDIPKVKKTELNVRKFLEKGRLKNKMSQAKLAQLLNIPCSTVVQWENGKVPIPGRLYQKINKILSINLTKMEFID